MHRGPLRILLPLLSQTDLVVSSTSDHVSQPNKSPCVIIHIFSTDSVPLENPNTFGFITGFRALIAKQYIPISFVIHRTFEEWITLVMFASAVFQELGDCF